MSARLTALACCILLLARSASPAQQKPLTLTGPKGNVWAVAFSPDGKLLATASDVSEKTGDNAVSIKGAEVRVWDAKSGQLKQTLSHRFQIASVAFSPDGKLLAAGAFKEIKLWDVAGGELKQTLKDFEGSAKGLAFSPDGKTLYSASSWFRKSEIRLWDVAAGKLDKALADPEQVEFTGLALSADGKTLVTSARVTEGGFSGRVRVWDLPAGTVRHTMTSPMEWINAVALTPDGKTVAAPVGFGVTVWDAQTGKPKREIKEFLAEVAITGDGKTLVGKINTTGGSDVKLIDLATGRTRRTIKVRYQGTGTMAVSKDGKLLAVGGGDAGTGEVSVQAIGR